MRTVTKPLLQHSRRIEPTSTAFTPNRKATVTSFGQFSERIYPYVGGLLGGVAAWFFRSTLPSLFALHDFFGAVLTLAGIAVGFLITVAAILMSIGDRWIMQRAREGGALRSLVDFLISATVLCFVVSIVSPLWLFANSHVSLDWFEAIRSIWIGVLTAAALSVHRVLGILFIILRDVSDPE